MLYKPIISGLLMSAFLVLLCLGCVRQDKGKTEVVSLVGVDILNKNKQLQRVYIEKDIPVEKYFQFIDSIVQKYDAITSYPLSEHLLVRTNTWIIDTLENTDYYRRIAKDSFVYDQKKMIVL